MMLKARTMCFLDAECVPSRDAAIKVFGLSRECSEQEAFELLWEKEGASEENPRPFLKPILTRVASISYILREDPVEDGEPPRLQLRSFPDGYQGIELEEVRMLEPAIRELSAKRPMLVSFNGVGFDFPWLYQRALVNGIRSPELFNRPDAPWQGWDYFSDRSNAHLDLMTLMSGGQRGKIQPTLHIACSLCGIPGKLDTSGADVAQLWLDGKYADISRYNDFDALSTYLLWAHCAYIQGALTREEYELEHTALKQMIAREAKQKPHLVRFMNVWQRETNMVLPG